MTKMIEDNTRQTDDSTLGPLLEAVEFEHSALYVSGKGQSLFYDAQADAFSALRDTSKGDTTTFPVRGTSVAKRKVLPNTGRFVLDCEDSLDTSGGFDVPTEFFHKQKGLTVVAVCRRSAHPTTNEDFLSIGSSTTIDFAWQWFGPSSGASRSRIISRVIDPETGAYTANFFAQSNTLNLNSWRVPYGYMDFENGVVSYGDLVDGAFYETAFTPPPSGLSEFDPQTFQAVLLGRCHRLTGHTTRPRFEVDTMCVMQGAHPHEDGGQGARLAAAMLAGRAEAIAGG